MTTGSGEVTMVCWHLLRGKSKAKVEEEEERNGLTTSKSGEEG